jgi:hypothetical protein
MADYHTSRNSGQHIDTLCLKSARRRAVAQRLPAAPPGPRDLVAVPQDNRAAATATHAVLCPPLQHVTFLGRAGRLQMTETVTPGQFSTRALGRYKHGGAGVNSH